MSSKNEYTLKDAINLFLDKKNYKKDILPYQIIDAYHQTAGPLISKLTASTKVSDKTLYLLITSAALRHELSYKKEFIIEEINKRLGTEAVEKIILT